MKYIFDDSALCYMLELFPKKAVPKLYNIFEEACINGNIIAEKETRKRLETVLEEESSYVWLDEHKKMFREINQRESEILGKLVKEKVFSIFPISMEVIRNIPIAIPFIIAIAINENRDVVVDKKSKDSELVKKICEKLDNVNCIFIDDYLAEIAE